MCGSQFPSQELHVVHFNWPSRCEEFGIWHLPIWAIAYSDTWESPSHSNHAFLAKRSIVLDAPWIWTSISFILMLDCRLFAFPSSQTRTKVKRANSNNCRLRFVSNDFLAHHEGCSKKNTKIDVTLGKKPMRSYDGGTNLKGIPRPLTNTQGLREQKENLTWIKLFEWLLYSFN